MSRLRRKLRDQTVVVKFDADTLKDVNAVADELYEGNRSRMVRVAVVEMLERTHQSVQRVDGVKDEVAA